MQGYKKALIILLAFDAMVALLLGSSRFWIGVAAFLIILNALIIGIALAVKDHYSSKKPKEYPRYRRKKYRRRYRQFRRSRYQTSFSAVKYNNFSNKPLEQQYGIKSITLKGEVVDSKKEKLIADYFYQKGIQYECHKPILADIYHSRILAVPDFYLPDYHVYVEYWGLTKVLNSIDRERYNQRKQQKISIYSKINAPLISLHESDLDNLHAIFPEKFRELTGYDLSQGQKRIS